MVQHIPMIGEELGFSQPTQSDPQRLAVVESPQFTPFMPLYSPAEMYQRTREALNAYPADVYIQGRAIFLDQKALLGVPFAFRSEWMFKREPAKQGISSKTGLPYKIDEQDVAQFLVSLLAVEKLSDPASWTLGEPQLCTVKGSYLLNQLRSTSTDEVAGYLWTFGRNAKMPAYTNSVTQQAEYPIMLARWVPVEPAQPSTFAS